MEILIDHSRFLKSVWYRHLLSRSLAGVASDDKGHGRVSIAFAHGADKRCCVIDPELEQFGEWLGREIVQKRRVDVTVGGVGATS
jgi:hypothetical protein